MQTSRAKPDRVAQWIMSFAWAWVVWRMIPAVVHGVTSLIVSHDLAGIVAWTLVVDVVTIIAFPLVIVGLSREASWAHLVSVFVAANVMLHSWYMWKIFEFETPDATFVGPLCIAVLTLALLLSSAIVHLRR